MTLDGYDLLEKLGDGALGEVHRARRRLDGRIVAMRVFPAGFAAGPDGPRRFRETAEALARLRHPNVVELYEALNTGEVRAAASELVDGRPLSVKLARAGNLPWKDAAAIVRQVASALGAAKEAGLAHLDLRPSSMFLRSDRSLKLADLGWTALFPERRVGTPTYTSPEQFRGDPGLDVRADLYALGHLLYEMLLSLPPYVSVDAHELRRLHTTERATFEIDGVPAALLDLGHRLTEPDRDRRLSDPAEAVRAIDALSVRPVVEAPARPETVTQAPSKPQPPMPKKRPISALRCFFGCLSLVFLGVAGLAVIGFMVPSKRPTPVAEKPKPVPKTLPPAEPKPRADSVPLERPRPPRPPPPFVEAPDAPKDVAADRAAIDAYLDAADQHAAKRDYDAVEKNRPALRTQAGRAYAQEALEPHRLAGEVVRFGRDRLAASIGKFVNVGVRDGSPRITGKLQAFEEDVLHVGGRQVPFLQVDTQSLVTLYAGSPDSPARAGAIFSFAVFEGNAPIARSAEDEAKPTARALKRLQALEQVAADAEAKTKRERGAQTALRTAETAFKDYRPELFWDVVDFHPGTPQAETAKAKLAELRTSIVRFAFNDGKPGGWSGDPVQGGRWARTGFTLKGLRADETGPSVCGIDRPAEPLFRATASARIRFDYRVTVPGTLAVTVGSGDAATVDAKIVSWRAFDQPLSDFKLPSGAAITRIRIAAQGTGKPADLVIDNVEVYEPVLR